MESDILVSIVVPVYNAERYLCQCLDSLRSQTLEGIEVVCVNDGSSDGSLSILREYERHDPRFRVVSKENAGYGHTMNCGFAEAGAPYVGILESDDFCAPDMCERLYGLASRHDLDIVRSDLSLYWSKPSPKSEKACFTLAEGLNEVFDPRDRPACFRLPPALCSMLVRKSLITDNGLAFLETPGASYQDTSFSFKLWACAQRAMAIDQAFVYYRQDNEASSIHQPDKMGSVPGEYEEIERFLRQDSARFAPLLPVMFARKFGAYVWNYERLAPEYHREFAELAAGEFRAAREGKLLDPALFSSEEWDDLMLLTNDPARFVARMDDWGKGEVKRFHTLSRIRRKIGLGEQ